MFGPNVVYYTAMYTLTGYDILCHASMHHNMIEYNTASHNILQYRIMHYPIPYRYYCEVWHNLTWPGRAFYDIIYLSVIRTTTSMTYDDILVVDSNIIHFTTTWYNLICYNAISHKFDMKSNRLTSYSRMWHRTLSYNIT